MRVLLAVTFWALVGVGQVHALGDLTALSMVQEECAEVGDIAFGPGKRWSACLVTRARWVATIEQVDLYQAQYCLDDGRGGCARRALLVFGNRAYTPTARLLIQRIDPGTTTYDDPLVIINDYGRIMTVAASRADGSRSAEFYRWKDGRWLTLDDRSWQRDLVRRLPPGVTTRGEAWTDVDTMRATVPLYHKADADQHPTAGVATASLGIAKGKFVLKGLVRDMAGHAMNGDGLPQ